MEIVQMIKSAKDFEFLRAEPWHRQGEHEKLKSRSDLNHMRHFQTRNCFF
jgi:hypothetical protein